MKELLPPSRGGSLPEGVIVHAGPRSAADPALNLANDPAWLTLLYRLCFILAPDVAALGNVFGYWAATHAYLVREDRNRKTGGPSCSRSGGRQQ